MLYIPIRSATSVRLTTALSICSFLRSLITSALWWVSFFISYFSSCAILSLASRRLTCRHDTIYKSLNSSVKTLRQSYFSVFTRQKHNLIFQPNGIFYSFSLLSYNGFVPANKTTNTPSKPTLSCIYLPFWGKTGNTMHVCPTHDNLQRIQVATGT